MPGATTLTVTDTSRDSCMVEWTAVTAPANSAITGYMLEIDDGLDGSYATVYDGTSTPSKFNYTAEGLTA